MSCGHGSASAHRKLSVSVLLCWLYYLFRKAERHPLGCSYLSHKVQGRAPSTRMFIPHKVQGTDTDDTNCVTPGQGQRRRGTRDQGEDVHVSAVSKV
eukprot:scaffold47607_cov77-Phaeocystis_antarctica.AAC.1